MNLQKIRNQIMSAVARTLDIELALAFDAASKQKLPLDGAKFYRYIRPLYLDPNCELQLHPTKGVTLFFNMDYITRMCTVSYSICDGELFDKSIGRLIASASASERSFMFPIPSGGFNENGIVDYVVRLVSATQDLGDHSINMGKIVQMYKAQ
jgi:hypothetical protein